MSKHRKLKKMARKKILGNLGIKKMADITDPVRQRMMRGEYEKSLAARKYRAERETK